jgi:beta-lactamase class A
MRRTWLGTVFGVGLAFAGGPLVGARGSWPVPEGALAQAAPSLSARIAAAMADLLPDGSGVYIDLHGGGTARYQSDQPRVAASTIKLPLVVEVLRQAESGVLDLSTPYTVHAEDVVGGTGILQGQVGRTLDYRELARYAILYSDNLAANVLLDRVGMGRVNATLRTLGYVNTRFERRLMDLEAEAQGEENWTTADDLAGMLHRLAQRTLISPAVSDQVLAMLAERGDRDPDWVGRGLPDGTLLSHLTGVLSGVRNDAGLIGLGQDHSYVLVVCTDQVTNAAQTERSIADVARRVNALASSY